MRRWQKWRGQRLWLVALHRAGRRRCVRRNSVSDTPLLLLVRGDQSCHNAHTDDCTDDEHCANGREARATIVQVRRWTCGLT